MKTRKSNPVHISVTKFVVVIATTCKYDLSPVARPSGMGINILANRDQKLADRHEIVQDYLFQFRDKIQAVTAQDVLSAAQRHLHPSKQDIVVAADASLNLLQLQKQSRPIVPTPLSQ